MSRLRGIVRRAAGHFFPGVASSLRCAGCGRDRASGAQLISGPGFYLCATCITAELPSGSEHSRPLEFGRCRWCGARRLRSQLRIVRDIPTCGCCAEVLAAAAAAAGSEARPET